MRRLVLVAVTSGLLLIAAGCDWPMFRNVPGHTGDSPDTSITPAALTSGSVMKAWTASTGFIVSSSPSVAAGVVYV
ncbi:MAG: hypothetical protein JOZ99_01325, partial [Actinobacteria bacterium]|nr:hypothetical protein [Actinomycetota bacterium]